MSSSTAEGNNSEVSRAARASEPVGTEQLEDAAISATKPLSDAQDDKARPAEPRDDATALDKLDRETQGGGEEMNESGSDVDSDGVDEEDDGSEADDDDDVELEEALVNAGLQPRGPNDSKAGVSRNKLDQMGKK